MEVSMKHLLLQYFPRTDNPELLICDVRPKSSFLGSLSVRLKILTAKSIDFCQTGMSSNELYSIVQTSLILTLNLNLSLNLLLNYQLE